VANVTRYDSQAQSDILATETSSDVQAMYTYENYLATQLPVIWLPTSYSQLNMINKDADVRNAHPSIFASEIPVLSDAPAMDRLVGFLGRDPNWTGGA
jgi:hypothetical protein